MSALKRQYTEMCKFMVKELCERAPLSRGSKEEGFTQVLTHKSTLLSNLMQGCPKFSLGSLAEERMRLICKFGTIHKCSEKVTGRMSLVPFSPFDRSSIDICNGSV